GSARRGVAAAGRSATPQATALRRSARIMATPATAATTPTSGLKMMVWGFCTSIWSGPALTARSVVKKVTPPTVRAAMPSRTSRTPRRIPSPEDDALNAPRILVIGLAFAALLLCRQQAQALATEQFGNAPIKGGFPTAAPDLIPVLNDSTRVYWYEVNGDACF